MIGKQLRLLLTWPKRRSGMSALFETDAARWHAVQTRDPRADGVFYYAVATTGIYCRPVCPSRRPKREHVTFFAQIHAAREKGYRACRRCRPDDAAIWRSEGDTAVRHAAVLFVDIKGFTRLTAVMRPDATMALLRGFHEIVAGEVCAHGGRVHKYLGDGLMAVFGDEAARPDDAGDAIACALGMLERLEAWNAGRRQAGRQPLKVGIGVHFGMVAFGRTGPKDAGEHAVVGASVNLASRLERVTRRLGTWLAISDDTVRALPSSRAPLLLGRLQRARDVRLNGCGLHHLWTERRPVADTLALPAAA
jgi:class 3 adenylate cyclase